MGNIVDLAPKAPVLAGFADADLDAQVVEAVKVLAAAKETYQHAVRSLDTQYLKPLAAAHDGDSDACKAVLAQVEAVRAMF